MPVEYFTTQSRVIRIGIQHQNVDAFSTIKCVASVLTFETVRVAPREHNIIPATTQQLVFAASTEECVSSPGAVGQSIHCVIRPRQIIAVQIIFPAITKK